MKCAINARLLTAAELTRQNVIFADIGTDHGYLPLFLLDEGRISRAYCCDINEGPLASARKNAEERGRLDSCEFILADGASALSGLGIDDYAICGMGGELIADIIDRAPHLRDPSVNLILQPMSRQEKLRRYLASSGFRIIRESYSVDAGKHYVCMLASFDGKCREITDLQSVAGFSDSDFTGEEHRLRYLEGKLKSLERAYAGRAESGTATSQELGLISELKTYINNLKTAEGKNI